jgi:hypothetical protein
VSNSSITKRSSILLFVFVVSVALVAADLVVLAQNGNGNTQGDQTRGGQMTSNGNMSGNMTNTNTGGGRRRRRRGTAANANASSVSGGDASGTMNATMQGNANVGDQTGNMMNTNTGGGRRRRRRGGNANTSGDMTGNANMTGDTGTTANTNMGGRRRRRRGGAGMTGMAATTTPVADSVQTDLSGTYTGTLSCSSLGGVSAGEGTLTITGNQWTFAPSGGGSSISGRIVAVTTRGYTAVAMQYGESVAPPPGGTSTPPIIVSLRGRKNGDNLSLTSIANGMKDCGFNPGGGMKRTGRRRGRRA